MTIKPADILNADVFHSETKDCFDENKMFKKGRPAKKCLQIRAIYRAAQEAEKEKKVKPVVKKPVVKKPVVKKPVDKKPVDEKPVVKKKKEEAAAKELPKTIKPTKAPCKPGKERINGRCVNQKLEEEADEKSPRKTRTDRSRIFHLHNPKAKKWDFGSQIWSIADQTKSDHQVGFEGYHRTHTAKVFFLTANKDLNPMIKSNINVNQNTLSLANKRALMNPINENQNVIKYIEKANMVHNVDVYDYHLYKGVHMMTGDIVYVGTSDISRPFYGFGIIDGNLGIDMRFGSKHLTKLIYGSKDEKDKVKEDLIYSFAKKRATLDHDMALKKIFKFISKF